MKWYVAKLVYRIVCGDGEHTPQFDEQLRLIAAYNEDEAFAKAFSVGKKEEDTFFNQRSQLVKWEFINVPEIYPLSALIDGAEIYSKINEVDDAIAYTTFVHQKAEQLQVSLSHRVLNIV